SAELVSAGRLEPNRTQRAFFVADSGRPFVVRVATARPGQQALSALYEPGGRPYRDRPPPREQEVGADTAAAAFWVDGHDAQAGVYEVDAFGIRNPGTTISMRVEQSPFRLRGWKDGSAAQAQVINLSAQRQETQLAYVLGGGEHIQQIDAKGSAVIHAPFSAPPWVREIDVDVEMNPVQWGRFTDFGLSLFDSLGTVVAKEPLNYSVGRLKTTLPEQHGELPLEVRLFPGFADPESGEAWKA